MEPFEICVNDIQAWIKNNAQGSCSVYVFSVRYVMTGWLDNNQWSFE